MAALLWVANLSGSVGRELEAQHSDDEALDRYVLGLRVLMMLKARQPWYPLDKAAYWLMSRAATVVGELAAQRGMQLSHMIDTFNSNMAPFAELAERAQYTHALRLRARSARPRGAEQGC